MTNMNGTTRTYNSANQMTNDGTNTLTYDANGNLTNDGTNYYTWDRANRMATLNNGVSTYSYAYDGMGRRVSQTVNSTVTQYLLDVQPGLAKVLAQTTGANTNRYIHAPRGIHAMEDNTGAWSYMAQDGLGSVRAEIDASAAVSASQNYAPYGQLMDVSGSFDSPFGFTGEQTDATGQVYLRARYYSPEMGIFSALDPFEGGAGRPMSLNGYSWVEGNPINWTDPSGEILPFLAMVVVGSTVIAGVTAASWNLFVEQGTGLGGANQFCFADASWSQVASRAQYGAGIGFEMGVSASVGYGVGSGLGYLRHLGMISQRTAYIGGAVADVGFGVAWDSFVHGDDPSNALLYNMVGFGAGEVVGYGGRQLGRSLDMGFDFTWRGLRNPLDTAATFGIVQSDRAIAETLRTMAANGNVDASTVSRLLSNRGWVGRASEQWLHQRNLVVVYRGHNINTYPNILSPLARTDGVQASEALVTRLRNAGLSDAEIAQYTANWHTQPVPGYFAPQGFADEPLGAVGVPTTRLPGLAANFAGEDGFVYVFRVPQNIANPVGAWGGGLSVEQEIVVFTQIPIENIVNMQSATNFPAIDVSDSGTIILPNVGD